MSTAILEKEKQKPSERIHEVARKLERHIHASELQPGDRYLSAEEGSRLLGESVMTVQRAMTLLSKRHILERRPRAGTFIGKSLTPCREPSCVHFLIPEECINERSAQEDYWEQIRGMRSVFPGLSAQFNFIPNQNIGYARQIVEQAGKANTLVGVVLFLPSRSMRAFFNQSGIPSFVEGDVESDLSNLGWYSYDQQQIGSLLAQWLLQRGHRQLVTVMRDVWSIGEHLLHDGIGQTLGQAGFAANALQVRSVPSEHSAITEQIRHILSQSADPPTGFICRTDLQADCVNEVAHELNLDKKIDITLCGTPQQSNKAKYVHVVPLLDAHERGRIVATMLQTLGQGKIPEPRGQIIPVELCAPAEAGR